MTSAEATAVAKRRALYVVHGDAAARHVGMFTWSSGHVTVRDLITTPLPQIPTIVRISEGYHGERKPHRFNFHEGSVSASINWCNDGVAAASSDGGPHWF